MQTQHRPIQLSTRSQALPEGGPEKAAPGLPVQAGAARLGQSSAEGHDGQAEQGAEVGRGLPLSRRVGGPLGLGAEAALLGLVAGRHLTPVGQGGCQGRFPPFQLLPGLRVGGRGAEAGLGAPTFLPDHTLQDLPLVLVQAHGKGAAIRADDLHLVHFDLRRGNLERASGSPGALPAPPLLRSCRLSATSLLGTTHLGPRGGGTQGVVPRPPSGPDSLPASALSRV